ncbi:MAG: efflux RND transporter periplasmic adaptor subunit [Elusimicrobia bacterium]|nr:efflux RND transporter periplasmic adaptor subunit [Elusimicrobiota bacterium]
MTRSRLLVMACLAVVVAGAGAVAYRARRGSAGKHAAQAAGYYCPMHPTYTSDKPGDCPICNMRLVPMEAHPQAAKPEAAKAARFYCPMHPTYTSDKPGDCPICNMKLLPAEEEASAAPSAAASGQKVCILHKCKMPDCVMELAHRVGEKVTCPVCGTLVFDVPPGAKPLYYRHPMRPQVTSPVAKKDEMGMDYVPVYAEQRASVPVEGQGSILLSEERRQMIGLKSEPVRRRDLTATVRASGKVAYDPDLYNALSEYREAVRARDSVKDSPYPDAVERADALVAASTLRLRQFGLTGGQIAESAKTAAPTNLLIGGSSVWVYAQIYEYEIGLIKPGMGAAITAAAYPGRSFGGTVRSLDPIVSAETRTLRARLEVPDPDGVLKPEMFINAEIKVPLGRLLALPESALLDTGERKLAFVDLGEGRIEPRVLRVGRKAEGYHELLSGMKEGEKAVTSANFLIDSESKLKAAISK